jgi:hypothetical protein
MSSYSCIHHRVGKIRIYSYSVGFVGRARSRVWVPHSRVQKEYDYLHILYNWRQN